MDADRFDALSRALTTAASRRTTLRALLGAFLGAALPRLSPAALAAAGKGNKGKGKTRHGHASSKHDRPSGRDAGGTTGRRKHSEKKRDHVPITGLTDESAGSPSDELAA